MEKTFKPEQEDDNLILIMPSYNQSHYISYAIDSIIIQSDPKWELWIIDNSTDRTPEVVKKYSDPRIIFHHIEARMDPGTCINWALERTTSRYFSYVHTDNNLGIDYVKQMRFNLAHHNRCIAYCDMRVIDDNGCHTSVFRRGEFDLARLASLSPLGVPFSASTSLARDIGGFSTRDVADDVLFCLLAYKGTEYIYIPEALIDYRLHSGSRTSDHGGANKMEKSFLASYSRALPSLEKNSVPVVEALVKKLELKRNDIELKVQDIWFKTKPRAKIKIDCMPSMEIIWGLTQFHLPDFKVSNRNLMFFSAAKNASRKRIKISQALQIKLLQRRYRKALKHELLEFRSFALPWLTLSAKNSPHDTRCWLDSTDIYTIWVAKMASAMLGWKVCAYESQRKELPAGLDIIFHPDDSSRDPSDVYLSARKGKMYCRHATQQT